MKIFVCEFITGGGLYREPLPASLAHEGKVMRDALLRDLAELPDVEIITTCDTRLTHPENAGKVFPVHAQDDAWDIWGRCMAAADAVWPIAPETGGALSRLTEMVLRHEKMLLGSSADAVNIAGSKLAGCKVLQKAGIPVVPTWTYAEWKGGGSEVWIAKPDDGAGCEGSRCFESAQALAGWIRGREKTHVIQPVRGGIPASISMLCKDGEAWLLSANLQKMRKESGRFVYGGSVLNDMADHAHDFEMIGRGIAGAIPGLAGYVGVDVLVNGRLVEVLEINPRLTTSYAGLRQAMERNPARLVVDLFYNDRFKLPPIAKNIIEISVNGA